MSCMKRAWRRLFGSTPMRILLLGLDAAGKTTILYQLMGKGGDTVPTIGFNVESVKVPPLEFLVWDVSGQERLRTFWRHYYHGTTGIVFVVDSHDVERLPIAKRELHGILKEEELSDAVLLIIANKTDLPNAVSTERLSQELDLAALRGRVTHIQPAVAQKGTGLKEGLIWLAKAMKAQSKQQARMQQSAGSGAQPGAIQPTTYSPASTQPYNFNNPYDAQTSNHVGGSSGSSSSSSTTPQQQPPRSSAASSSSSVVEVPSVAIAQPLVVLAPPSSTAPSASSALPAPVPLHSSSARHADSTHSHVDQQQAGMLASAPAASASSSASADAVAAAATATDLPLPITSANDTASPTIASSSTPEQ